MAEAHASPRRVAHFAILQMKSRVRKQIEIAGVIVMHVSHDHILDRLCTHAEARQRFHRIEREFAISQARFQRVEPGIDQDVATLAADKPDEIIEVGGGRLVRIRREIVHVGSARRHRRIAQGKNFVHVFHWFTSSAYWLAASKSPAHPKVKQGRSWWARGASLVANMPAGTLYVFPVAWPSRAAGTV